VGYKQKALIDKGLLSVLPSPQFIITIEDWNYMAGLREKVGEIKIEKKLSLIPSNI